MSTYENGSLLEILLVEDNPGDITLTKEAFDDAKIRNNLTVVQTGSEVIPYLKQEGEYSNSTRPDLILLDLNLPRKSGLEILKDIRADEKLKRIPVVVLTTSEAEKDVLGAYDLNANSYVTKPVDLDKFIEVIKSIEGFWLTFVKYPKE